MKSLRTPWRWPLSILAAFILLLLLATGAARYYPVGDLLPRRDDRFDSRVLVVMPALDVMTEVIEMDEPDPKDDQPPSPEPDAFRSLWGEWIAGRALEVWDGPHPSDEVVVLEVPLPSWEQLFRAPADTTDAGVLARSGLLWEQRWQDLKPWATMGHAMMKAERYQAMKKSVFNEDWLSSEHLK